MTDTNLLIVELDEPNGDWVVVPKKEYDVVTDEMGLIEGRSFLFRKYYTGFGSYKANGNHRPG